MNVEAKTGLSGGREAVVVLTVAVREGDERDPMTIATQLMNEAVGRVVQPWEEADTAGIVITNVDAVAVESAPAPLTDEAKLNLVEDAWYDETKGEISVVPNEKGEDYDAPLAAMVLEMWREVRQMTDETASSQHGYSYDVELADVSDDEVARRIAVALNGLWFGGKS